MSQNGNFPNQEWPGLIPAMAHGGSYAVSGQGQSSQEEGTSHWRTLITLYQFRSGPWGVLLSREGSGGESGETAQEGNRQ